MAESIVYNMDCMEAMRHMPDKWFDLAVVDPPYRDMAENQPTKDMRKMEQWNALETNRRKNISRNCFG